MVALITSSESRKAEEFAKTRGVSGAQLMEAAGAAVAETILRRFSGGPTLVLCGPGNNGGDGYVIARLLRRRGWSIRVAASTTADDLPVDAADMAKRWHGITVHLGDLEKAWMARPLQLVVDALFGAGLKRDVSGDYAYAIEKVKAWGVPVVAVDVPSGVDSDSGEIHGAALPAKITVSFFRARPGHYLLPGRNLCGELMVRDIGIPDAAMEMMEDDHSLALNRPSIWRTHLPQSGMESHKYHRGHVLVFSGDLSHTGAARLAARAALRCGAGLVTLASPPGAVLAHAAHETAVMIKSVEAEEELAGLIAERRVRAVVLGPGNGVGERTRRFVLAALKMPVAVVLDADALTSFMGREDELSSAVAARNDGGQKVVLTPHAGEFERLFPTCGGNKLAAAREAALRVGAVLVYKGADCVIADSSGRAMIADNAPPSLATAGSGDVLAGMIGGLLGAKMPGFEAAACGVWMHGEAAQRFGAGLTADDLPGLLPGVWQQFGQEQD